MKKIKKYERLTNASVNQKEIARGFTWLKPTISANNWQ